MKANPTLTFGGAPALVAFTLLPASAEAQLLFGSRLGQAHYQGDDTKIIMRVGADMLRNVADGESRFLVQPANREQRNHHRALQLQARQSALPLC